MRRSVVTTVLLGASFAAAGCSPEPVRRFQRLPDEVDAAGRPATPPPTGQPPNMPGSPPGPPDGEPSRPAETTDGGPPRPIVDATAGAPDGRMPQDTAVASPDARPADPPRPAAAGILAGIAPVCTLVSPAADVVSDFEEAATVLARGGRVASPWELVHDGTATATIARATTTGACGGQGSLHMSGNGFTKWGAATLGFFHNKLPYDAAGFRGVRVRLRASAPVLTRLKVTDVNNWGGASVCKVCGNSFGRDAQLGTDWREYVLWFDDLTQTIDGDRFAALDRRALVAFEVIGRVGDAFDIWVDDLALFR